MTHPVTSVSSITNHFTSHSINKQWFKSDCLPEAFITKLYWCSEPYFRDKLHVKLIKRLMRLAKLSNIKITWKWKIFKNLKRIKLFLFVSYSIFSNSFHICQTITCFSNCSTILFSLNELPKNMDLFQHNIKLYVWYFILLQKKYTYIAHHRALSTLT